MKYRRELKENSNTETKKIKLIKKNNQRIIMRKVILKSSGSGLQKEYQHPPLSYQEAKTEWINKKRKIKWNLIPRSEKNNKR